MKSISIFSIFFVLFIGWVILGPTPDKRIERSCQPIVWVGNIAVSFSLLVGSERGKNTIEGYTEDVDYGCRYSVWRLMYGPEYDKQMKDQKTNVPAENEKDKSNGSEPSGIIM
jgi:hypothetical protein